MTNRWTPAKGDTFYTYDLAHNLTNIVYPVSSNIVFAYDASHRLTNMIDGVGTTKLAYKNFGALWTEDGPWANDTVTYNYTINHLRSSITVQQGSGPNVVQSYGYDAANRLQSISSPAGTFTYGYSGASAQVRKLDLPGGSYITNNYDTVGRQVFTKLLNSAHSALSSHSYLHDLAGQRTNQTRYDGSTVAYAYDPIGQLKSAAGKESGGTSRLNEQFGYAYDAAWNLQARTNNALVQTNSDRGCR